jgi:hypothetical protein
MIQPFFSLEFTFTDDGWVENIFWADSASRFEYKCFGDVFSLIPLIKRTSMASHL